MLLQATLLVDLTALAICLWMAFYLSFGAPIILHIGRMDADKRVDRVILAAANFSR